MTAITYELWRGGTLVSTGLYSEEKVPSQGEEVTVFNVPATVKSVLPARDGTYRIVVEARYGF